MQTLHDIIMKIVSFVMRLTPFGVLALMTKKFMASSDWECFRSIRAVFNHFLCRSNDYAFNSYNYTYDIWI